LIRALHRWGADGGGRSLGPPLRRHGRSRALQPSPHCLPFIDITVARSCSRVPVIAPASASSQPGVEAATRTIGKGGGSRAVTHAIEKGGNSRAASVGHLGLPPFQNDVMGVEAPASLRRPRRCKTTRGWG
jgi:hypothetical protein